MEIPSIDKYFQFPFYFFLSVSFLYFLFLLILFYSCVIFYCFFFMGWGNALKCFKFYVIVGQELIRRSGERLSV